MGRLKELRRLVVAVFVVGEPCGSASLPKAARVPQRGRARPRGSAPAPASHLQPHPPSLQRLDRGQAEDFGKYVVGALPP